MNPPKCYTLINKMYDPIKDMRETRRKLNEFNEKHSDSPFIEIVGKYIDNDDFPSVDAPYYVEILERLELLRKMKNLKIDYPKHHRWLMKEESKEFRERIQMMNEDH